MEADFQQYYHLEIDKIKYQDLARVSRLLGQLPPDSRIMTTLNPGKDWNWDRETQSRILAKLDHIYVLLGNSFRDKKKTAKIKPEPQWQPDYVREAKDEAKTRHDASKKLSKEDLEATKAFWKHKNPDATFLEDKV